MGSIYEYKTSGDVYVILVGNKCDLLERREVSLEEGRELANKYQVAYFETSAKEDIGVNECFEKLIHDSVMFAHPIKENEIVDNKGIGCCY